MSEVKIEHLENEHLYHYLITASDGSQSICWKGDADYSAIEQLTKERDSLDKLLDQVYDDICCGSSVTKPTARKLLAREHAKHKEDKP